METIPPEVLELILLHRIRQCCAEKNAITSLRLVCKAFDTALKPYIFRTLQLEFSKFQKSRDEAYLAPLDHIGQYCHAVYLDMMVVRDEEEITRLTEVFNGILSRVPEMVPLLESLRRYCMNERTFNEEDFKTVITRALMSAPYMTRLKLNLPFQVVGRASSTATLLLATTLACIAHRPRENEEGHWKRLETLVIDHLSDTALSNICSNHLDASNTVVAFMGLKNLVLSIKRQEDRASRQTLFTKQLWFLITKAVNLESLCLVGWNARRNKITRRHRHGVPLNEWNMRSLPYIKDIHNQPLENLRYLELKRLDINPEHLINFIRDSSSSLEELYFNDVYLKVSAAGGAAGGDVPLWIGLPDVAKPTNAIWVAESLNNMEGLKLGVLRATGLGYDDFDSDNDLARSNYDLDDPSGMRRSFDLRFVEAANGRKENFEVAESDFTQLNEHTTPDLNMTDPGLDVILSTPGIELLPPDILIPLTQPLTANDFPVPDDVLQEYDALTYQRIHHSATSNFKKCIDGYFYNHNEQALKELQLIIEVADRGMNLISAEIDRNHLLEFDPDNGLLIP